MDDISALIVSAAGLMLAFGVAPWLASRVLMPRATLTSAVAGWGCSAVAMAGGVLLSLHAAGIPIGAAAAALMYAGLTACVTLLAGLRRVEIRPRVTGDERPVAVVLLAFAVLVVPVTALAGIDTYKWQDLATSVILEQRIAWLVHPLSLFGFTPRSYPSAQPLVLATAQLFGAGVEWGYFLVSLVAGFTGICGMFRLAERVFGGGRTTAWAAVLYGLAPVFVRYTHWATGRGLFLALFPLFLLACTRLPHWRAWAGAAAGAVALALCHKTGGVAVALMAVAGVLALALPRSAGRLTLALAIVPFAVVASMAAPGSALGAPLSVARAGFMRFGVLLPLAAVSLAAGRRWIREPGGRMIAAGACVALPLSFTGDAYGALVLLPFAALMAADGVATLGRVRGSAGRILGAVVLVLAAGAAGATVVHRSMLATPRAVRSAALFLEAYDPAGPFTVHGPPRVQAQVQAYVSGCPRFDVTPGGAARISVTPPPPLRGAPREAVAAWTRWLREVLALSDTDVSWYGRAPRAYYVTVSGAGEKPAGARSLYERDGVSVYAPAGQADPPGARVPGIDRGAGGGL